MDFDSFMNSDDNAKNRITHLTRRDILDYLITRRPPYHGRLSIVSFLNRIFDLSRMPSTDRRFTDAAGDIGQHMIANNDWDDEYLLYTYLNLIGCEDELFLSFIEQLVHPIVLADGEVVRESVTLFNDLLKHDGFKLEIKDKISGRPIYKSLKAEEIEAEARSQTYEVVLSYAGENRDYVSSVASYLREKGVSFFYDRDEEATLWGKSLTEYLHQIFGGNARYCIMFISQAYAEKIWTNHEKKVALAKAVGDRTEYILPVRFDDTELPGLPSDTAYVDARKKSPTELGNLIISKLSRKP
jgi:hypothetical protein